MVKKFVPNETKRERFKRIATARTKVILYKLRVLGNCANRNNYEYTEDDVRLIFNVINEELKRVKSQFKKPIDKDFKL